MRTLARLGTLLWFVTCVVVASGEDVLLFTYFRDNGQAGVFLAQSSDGVTFTPLNDEHPIFTPPKWPGRNLRLTFASPDLDRPNFTPVSAPIAGTHSPMFSHPDAIKSMAEGQSLVRYRGQWWLCWDEPAGHGMQLGTSPDLVTWTHKKKFTFPAKAKHGTAFLAPRAAVGWLDKTPRPANQP